AGLAVVLRDDADARELARHPGAVSGREHDLRGDEGAGTAERRLPGDIHNDQDDGGMIVAVERAVRDEGGAIRAEIGGDSVAAEHADASCGNGRNDETRLHGSSLRVDAPLKLRATRGGAQGCWTWITFDAL